jgi:hypothetical protein
MTPIEINDYEIIAPTAVKPDIKKSGEQFMLAFVGEQKYKIPVPSGVSVLKMIQNYISSIKTKKRVFTISEEIKKLQP